MAFIPRSSSVTLPCGGLYVCEEGRWSNWAMKQIRGLQDGSPSRGQFHNVGSVPKTVVEEENILLHVYCVGSCYCLSVEQLRRWLGPCAVSILLLSRTESYVLY